MPNCPECKSKHIVPIVYAPYSEIIRRGAAEGRYLTSEEKQKPESPILHCMDCGFDWSPTALSWKYITKLRWKLVEFDQRVLGTKILELMPDGQVRYYEYYGESKKAAVIKKGTIPMWYVEYTYRVAADAAPFDAGDYFTCFEPDFRLQVSYADGYKNVFSGRTPQTNIGAWLERVLCELPEIGPMFREPMTLENAEKADAEIAKAAAAKARANAESGKDGNQADEKPDRKIFFLKSRKSDAKGIWVKDGFLVLSGSRLASTETRSCRKQVHDRRQAAIDQGEVKDWILQQDKLFKGVSPACEFISGGLGDGNLWKNYRGTSAKDDPTMDEHSEEMEALEEEMTEAESAVTDILLDENLIDTYPRGFFFKSLEELNEHFGGHDDMIVTERVRRYCQLMLEFRDYLDDLILACQEAEQKKSE